MSRRTPFGGGRQCKLSIDGGEAVAAAKQHTDRLNEKDLLPKIGMTAIALDDGEGVCNGFDGLCFFLLAHAKMIIRLAHNSTSQPVKIYITGRSLESGKRRPEAKPQAASVAASLAFAAQCRKSAARWACEAAVKIARLSSFRTLIHDEI